MPAHLRWMLALYSLVGLAATLWASLRPGAGLAEIFTPHPPFIPWLSSATPALRHTAAIVLGLTSGAVLVGLSILASRHFLWAKRLEQAFTDILGPLRKGEVLILALASGLAEEALFRGLLQPWWGWLPASLAFGLLHIGPERKFLPWTIMALVSGGLLGGLSLLSGSLWAPITCHIVINACNLYRIAAQGPAP